VIAKDRRFALENTRSHSANTMGVDNRSNAILESMVFLAFVQAATQAASYNTLVVTQTKILSNSPVLTCCKTWEGVCRRSNHPRGCWGEGERLVGRLPGGVSIF
jgi:hypothetical protein